MEKDILESIFKSKWFPTVRFYAVSVGFILLNLLIILKKGSQIGVFIPIIYLFLLFAIFSYDKLIWLAILAVPLSLQLKELLPSLPVDLSLPSEPIIILLLFLTMVSLFMGKRFDKKLVKHPVTIAIFIYIFWIFITSFFSTEPIISFKFLVSRVWFIVTFYFLIAVLLKEQKNYERFIWFYVAAMVPVIFYTIFRHIGYGLFDKQAAHFVMTPFFNDHTSYGAILAMYIPFLVGFTFSNYYSTKRYIFVLFIGLFFIAIALSYARAAWLSLFVALGVWALMKLQIKFKTIFLTFLSLLVLFFVFQEQVIMKLERNNQDSSANFMKHLTSMTNISTDASNLERINRWNCALRMFEEKPFLGWGPGTYAMEYAPFQVKRERTIISTNSGNGGNAHSEYLGALSETGIIGLLTFIALISIVVYTGVKTYSRSNDKRVKTLVASAVAGLITYYVHGTLNNFLDTDKASVPFWGFTAMIVALDIYTRQQVAEEKKNTPIELQPE